MTPPVLRSDYARARSTSPTEVTARIQKFTATGVYQSQFGGYGTGSGQFDSPSGVAVSSTGEIYVADRITIAFRSGSI